MGNYVNEYEVIKLTNFVGFFPEPGFSLIQPVHFSEPTCKQQFLGRVKFKTGSFHIKIW